MRTEEMIVSMYSIITGKDDYKEIHNTLLRSQTFREVLKRNEALLYEGYASNLLDIAQELTDAGVLEAKMITPDAIKIVNRARKYEAGKRSVLKAANGNELLKSHDDDNLGSVNINEVSTVSSYEEYKNKAMKDTEVKAEYDALKSEFDDVQAMIDMQKESNPNASAGDVMIKMKSAEKDKFKK